MSGFQINKKYRPFNLLIRHGLAALWACTRPLRPFLTGPPYRQLWPSLPILSPLYFSS